MMAGYESDIFDAPARGYDPDIFTAPEPTRASKPFAPQREPSMLDAPNAVATGVNRGALGIAGLPVDTMANIVDLGKAALGAPYIAVTGKAPPDWLQPVDRGDVIGSSAWLLRQADKTDLTKALFRAANPEYEGGYLQNAGAAIPGALVGTRGSLPQMANSAILNVGGATAGKAVYDATGDPTAATFASMAVPALQLGGSALLKRAVRGNEAGRQDMAQRITDLENAGVSNPTLGLASGNSMVGGVENLLQSTPGAVGVMRRSRDAAINGLQSTLQDAAQTAAPIRGNTEAGLSIRSDITGPFMDNFRATQKQLYDKLDQYIAAGDKVGVNATQKALQDLTKIDPQAPNLSAGFVNGKINDIRARFDMDTGATPSGSSFTTVVPVRGPVQMRTNAMGVQEPSGPVIRNGSYPVPGYQSSKDQNPFSGIGVPTTSSGSNIDPSSRSYIVTGSAPTRINALGLVEPAGPIVSSQMVKSAPRASTNPLALGSPNFPAPDPILPYGTLKQQRTNVGEQINTGLLSGAPDAQWKRLYAGMSEDMQGAANAAGPDASNAWSRANDYTRAGMQRLETVSSFANEKAPPEQIYTRLIDAAKTGTSTLQAVKKSLTPDTRGQIAGTLIEQLGTSKSGSQNDQGTAWSPETFLTNWDKIKNGRSELLSGFKDADQVRAQVEAVAKATSMMRDNSKMWANPSGTGANTFARGVLLGTPLAAAANPAVGVGAAGGLIGANGLARLLTNKSVVDSFANRTNLSAPTYTGLLTNLATRPSLLYQGQ